MDERPITHRLIQCYEQDFIEHLQRAFQTSAAEALKRINQELVAGKLQQLGQITSGTPGDSVEQSRKRRGGKGRAAARESAAEGSA